MKFKHILLTWVSLVVAVAAAAGPPASDTAKPRIYSAEMTYGLFMALTDYQELNELESEQHQNVNIEMQSVLQAIIEEFTKEKHRFEGIQQEQPQRREELQARIEKIDRNLHDFNRELVYRNQAAEVDRLMQQQQKLMEEQE